MSRPKARLFVCSLLFVASAVAQSSACLIQSNAVGAVKVGMSVKQARLALSGAKITTSEDLEKIEILTVTRDGKRVMDLYPDQDDPRKELRKIELIRVYDPACSTADGVHPGMPLRDVEQRYGRVTRLVATETEPREYAELEKLPSWLQLQPGTGDAGVYPKGKRCSPTYSPTARVTSLWVSHPITNKLKEDDSFCNTPPPRKQ